MEKLTKKIEFVGDKLNASNFTTEFRIASYKTNFAPFLDKGSGAIYFSFRLD